MTDKELKTIIVDKLRWDERVNASEVNVVVDNCCKVTLIGTVSSYRAKRTVEEDVREVVGIIEVDNQLRVQYLLMTPVLTDEEVASSVANALTWNPDIDANKIDVMPNQTLPIPALVFTDRSDFT